jgi:hypothetical protein
VNGGEKIFSAYSLMFTKRKLSNMMIVIVSRLNDAVSDVRLSLSSQQKRRENNKNKTETADEKKGKGGHGMEFSKFTRNVTFWPYFEEARESARVARQIRESTKLSGCGGRAAEGAREKKRDRERNIEIHSVR